MAEFMLPPLLKRKPPKKRWQPEKSKREAGIKKRRDEKTETVFLTFCPGEMGARWGAAHACEIRRDSGSGTELRIKEREVAATTQALCVQKSGSASPPVTESVKYRQIKAHKPTKGCTSPFFVVWSAAFPAALALRSHISVSICKFYLGSTPGRRGASNHHRGAVIM